MPEATRPKFPSVYGIHEDAADLLAWEWAVERLEAARNYWVSTAGPERRPHAMPVWGIWLDEAFYFSTSPDSRKARNLAANPAVVVHLESGDEVVILEGEIETVGDDALAKTVSDVYSRKYGYVVDFTGPRPLSSLRPWIAYAWREQDYPATATRFRF